MAPKPTTSTMLRSVQNPNPNTGIVLSAVQVSDTVLNMINENPPPITAITQLANYALTLKSEKNLPFLNSVIQMMPKYYHLYKKKMEFLYKLNDSNGVIVTCDTLIELFPNKKLEFMVLKCPVLLKQKKYNQMNEIITEILANSAICENTRCEARYYKAKMLRNQLMFDEALLELATLPQQPKCLDLKKGLEFDRLVMNAFQEIKELKNQGDVLTALEKVNTLLDKYLVIKSDFEELLKQLQEFRDECVNHLKNLNIYRNVRAKTETS